MTASHRIRVTHVTTVPMSLMFLRGQAAFMRERGIDLSAVSSPGAELDAFGVEEGIPVYAVAMERRITPLKDLVSLARLYAHFRATKPDIVHAHTPKGGLLGTIAATLARVPRRIYHMRGLPLMGATGAKRALLTLSERVSCALASEVLCVSHSLRTEALTLRLARAENIQVLGGGSGQGVDTERFDPARFTADDRARTRTLLGIPADALVYGFVGRIVRDKGIRELVHAWQQVRERLPHAHLLVVGPSEAQDAIDVADRQAMELDDRVHIVGFVTDTPALYVAMDVVVLPTYREGFPNVPLEAASMARPVLATRIPGCIDAVIDEKTGVLVPPRDTGSLAQALLRYADPSLRTRHGMNGRLRATACFGRQVVLARLAAFYRLHGASVVDAHADNVRRGSHSETAL